MADFISREAAKAFLKRAIFGADSKIDKWVDAIPAADVVESKRGEWERVEVNRLEDLDEDISDILLISSMFCPVCKRYHNEVYLYGNPTEGVHFCPNCGADMRPEPPKEET